MAVIDFPQFREKESFLYSTEIKQPFGGIDSVLAWCRTEIVGDWRWHVLEMSSVVGPGRYEFFFDLDRDFCAFLLKWHN